MRGAPGGNIVKLYLSVLNQKCVNKFRQTDKKTKRQQKEK